MIPIELFMSEIKVISDVDEGYTKLAEANNYEIEYVTAERYRKDGTINAGAAFVNVEGDSNWIPKSVLAVDSDSSLYVEDWYFLKL